MNGEKNSADGSGRKSKAQGKQKNNIYTLKTFTGSPSQKITAIKNEINALIRAASDTTPVLMQSTCALLSKYLYDILVLDRSHNQYLATSKIVFDFQRWVLERELRTVLHSSFVPGADVPGIMFTYNNLVCHYNTLVPTEKQLLPFEAFLSLGIQSGLVN